MNDYYNDMFKILDSIDIEDKKPIVEKTELKTNPWENCKHCITNDNTCLNCGLVTSNLFFNENEMNWETHQLYNRYNYNATFIQRTSANYRLNRIHLFSNRNHSYNFRKKCYKQIEDIIKNNNLNININYIKNQLNILYVDKKNRFRGDIKKSIYIIFIFNYCLEQNIEIDIYDILKNENLKIDHYNKAIHKLNKEANIVFDLLPTNIKLLTTKYNNKEIISKYNNLIKQYPDFRNKRILKKLIKSLY